ncbi:MAG: TonB family protein, partial [Aphanizomenon sp.]
PTKTAISIIKSSVAPVTKQNPPKTSNNFITKQSQILTSPEPRTAPKLVKINPTENTSSEPTITTNPVKTNLIEKLDENSNNFTSTPPQGNTKTADIPNNSTTSTQLPQNINSLSNLGDRLGNNLDKGTGIGNGVDNGVGNGVGNVIGNKQKPENTPVATATKPPKENGSTLNRADCIQCKIKYPDRARRRGAEGNPEVSINTDLNGNVTQVRLIRSSGDRELDEAAQKAAQEWKLTPTEGGREGVKASVNFAIKGSQRHRQLQERQTKKEREVAKKKPEKETFTSNSVESSQGNQRKITPIITDVPTENTTRRNPASAPSESKSSTESNSDL